MNEMRIFEDQQFGKIRTVLIGSEPWFVAADVCKALDIGDTGRAIERLDEDEGTRIQIAHPQSPLKSMEVWAVNEPGLYSLVLGSRKSEAKAFKRWITHEVIPSIRKHGMYATPQAVEAMLQDPDVMIKTLQAFKEERERRRALEVQVAQKEQRIEELQPFADYVAYILSSVGTVTITQIAADYGLSAKRLNQILKEERVQRNVGGQWVLYKSYMQKGLTESETFPIEHSNGNTTVRILTKWTQKGRLFINQILNKRGIFANIDYSKLSKRKSARTRSAIFGSV